MTLPLNNYLKKNILGLNLMRVLVYVSLKKIIAYFGIIYTK